MRLLSLAVAAALLSGCAPILYRGYTAYEGTVIDSQTRKPIAGVQVTACLLDRYPGASTESCASAVSRRGTVTDGEGRFELAGSRHLGVFILFPHGRPGPFDTNLFFEKEGFSTRELDWYDDRHVLAAVPLVVVLERGNDDEAVRFELDDPGDR